MCENEHGGRFVHSPPSPARPYDGPRLESDPVVVKVRRAFDDEPNRAVPDRGPDCVAPVADHASDIEAEVRRRLEARRCGKACRRPACKEERPTLRFECGSDAAIVPSDPETERLVRFFGFATSRANDLISGAAFMGYDVLIRAAF